LLAKVNGLDAIYLLTFEPSHPLRFRANVGDHVRSLYATSGGKAILARLSAQEFNACLRSLTLTPLTKHTITSKPALREEIEAGRARGWYLNREESQDGVMTLSALFAWNGLSYVVTIAGPISRIEPRLDWMAGLLVDACRRLEMSREVA